MPPSPIAVRAVGANGGGIPAFRLALQLPKPVAEILHLTGAQDTANSHQMSMMEVSSCTALSILGCSPRRMAQESGTRLLVFWYLFGMAFLGG